MLPEVETISSEWIVALRESLDVFGSLLLEKPVVDAWANPSNLARYTVGGIAGHVLALELPGFRGHGVMADQAAGLAA